jgi:RND superfamily putative drug exporter
MTGALERLANTTMPRPKAVILLALSLAIAAGVFGLPVVDELHFSSSDLDARGSQSVDAAAAIERATGAAPAPTIFALLHSRSSILSAKSQNAILAVAHTIEAQQGIAQVASYPGASLLEKASLRPYFSSNSGHWGFVAAITRGGVLRTDRASALAKRLLTRFPPGSGILLGGSTIADEELGSVARRELDGTELWVLPLLALLLIWIFRRPAAAALPLLIGLITVVETLAMLRILKLAGAQISLFALPTATGLSLGLGIDYSLLGISRSREEAEHRDCPALLARVTLRTAGRTISFSAATIGCCMAALMLLPVPLIFSVGLAVGICACVAQPTRSCCCRPRSCCSPGIYRSVQDASGR